MTHCCNCLCAFSARFEETEELVTYEPKGLDKQGPTLYIRTCILYMYAHHTYT